MNCGNLSDRATQSNAFARHLARHASKSLVARACAILMCVLVSAEGVAAPTNGELGPRLQIESGTHSAPVRRLAVAADRNLVVTASDDKSARVWDLASGQLRHVLRSQIGDGEIGRLYGAAIHPTEDSVAIAGTTGAPAGAHRILIFSPSSGRFLRSIDAHGGDVKNLTWSADGTLLFAAYAGDHALRAFDTQGSVVYHRRLAAAAYGLSSSAAGQIAATSLDGTIVILDARGGRVTEQRQLRAGDQGAVGVSFSPDGSKLLIGFLDQTRAPELFDIAAGKSLGRIRVPEVSVGNFLSVAWSLDGAVLAAAGSARSSDGDRKFDVFFFDAASGRLLARQPTATNTILDLKALPGRRFAYASFDGSWGLVEPQGKLLQVNASIADMRGADRLLISPDARIVQWSFGAGEKPATFDFSNRLVTMGSPRIGLNPAVSKAGWADNPRWENTSTPEVRGHAIALAPDEVSRSLAYFGDRRAALLGTSQRLIRVDDSGRIDWQVRAAGEVRAVNLSANGRLAVTAMSDGSLRWWRTTDGALLLSLLVASDGRWVAWTESGYFDASAGADRLAGWAVNRVDMPVADFFSLSRFREKFNRPAEIDHVLQTLETVAAAAPLSPPVLEAEPLSSIGREDSFLTIPYSVRLAREGPVELEVRIDGRPAPDAKIIKQSSTENGGLRGRVRLSRPETGSTLQLLARNAQGISEPLGFSVKETREPALPAVQAFPGASAMPATSAIFETPTASTSAPDTPAIGPDSGGVIQQALKVTSSVIPVTVLTGNSSTPVAAAAPSILTGANIPVRTSKQPRLLVLAIGISLYKNPEYRLGLPAKDAKDFTAAMKSQEGRLYSEVIGRTLTDGQATRQTILEGFRWLSQSTGSSDVGMLFFAGHGLNGSDGQYYFLPHDADHERLKTTGISEEELRKALASMQGKALLFVDTCFGGGALSRAGSSELARMANNLSAAENGVVVFASSSGRQLSEENDAWGNGAFTKAVLAGLSGKADLTRSGRVTFKGLDFYVSEEVSKLTEGRQTPVTISPTGVPDFALARVGAT